MEGVVVALPESVREDREAWCIVVTRSSLSTFSADCGDMVCKVCVHIFK